MHPWKALSAVLPDRISSSLNFDVCTPQEKITENSFSIYLQCIRMQMSATISSVTSKMQCVPSLLTAFLQW